MIHFSLVLFLAATSPSVPSVPSDDVGQALEAFFAQDSVQMTGTVRIETQGAPGGMMMMGFGGTNDSVPFAGKIEVLRRPVGVLIASKKQLPGVAVYATPLSRLTRVTCGEKKIDAKTLAQDLPDLLNAKELIKLVAETEWQSETDPESGVTIAEAKLSKSLIKVKAGGGGPMGFSMSKTVEHVLARFEMTAGRISKMTFTVVRFNPERAMQRRFMSGELGGDQDIQIGPEAFEFTDDEKEESDMDKDVYELQVAGAALSERSQALFTELKKIAEAAETF